MGKYCQYLHRFLCYAVRRVCGTFQLFRLNVRHCVFFFSFFFRFTYLERHLGKITDTYGVPSVWRYTFWRYAVCGCHHPAVGFGVFATRFTQDQESCDVVKCWRGGLWIKKALVCLHLKRGSEQGLGNSVREGVCVCVCVCGWRADGKVTVTMSSSSLDHILSLSFSFSRFPSLIGSLSLCLCLSLSHLWKCYP